MIKFFRRIRKKLLDEGDLKKYLIYAIGEIFLVMVGILLALQVNNWNEDKKAELRGSSFLVELKKNIESDIAFLELEDSIRGMHEFNSEKALSKFYQAKNFQDLLEVDSLFTYELGDLKMSRTVYDEMLNTGSIYTLKNDILKKKIADYYTAIESIEYIIKEIDATSTELSDNHASRQLILISRSNGVFTNKIKDTWIGDPNHPEYLALHQFYIFTQTNTNITRRRFYKYILYEGKELLKEIEKELN